MTPTEDLLAVTGGIACAFLANNAIPASDVPDMVAGVHAALMRVVSGPTEASNPVAPKPAVPVRQSVKDDHIVCLEDGLRFRSLKRHLGKLGLTPQQYREKWGLPDDYPMVAPGYAKERSRLAKESGLGRKPAAAAKARRDDTVKSAPQAGRRAVRRQG